MKDFWDMPRIAAAFGISPSTVQGGWRNGTLNAVRAHLAENGYPDAADALGIEPKLLTQEVWRERRPGLGLPPLRLPRQALPLPNLMLGNKPGWSDQAIQRWADDTGRRTADGGFCKASPTGRPPGVVESQPRRRREPAAAA